MTQKPRRRGLSQEGLKGLAAGLMLIDHLGLCLFSGQLFLRAVGRLAFPIYAFLLAEGARHTRSPVRYGGRLVLLALASELPFDFMRTGRWIDWSCQNVMVTLALGLALILCLQKARFLAPAPRAVTAVFSLLVFGWLAEAARSDYGAFGVWLCAVFAETRNSPAGPTLQGAAMILGSYLRKPAFLLGLPIPLEALSAMALLPIGLYHGQKRTSSLAVRTAFYAFYPLHMLLLGILHSIWPL